MTSEPAPRFRPGRRGLVVGGVVVLLVVIAAVLAIAMKSPDRPANDDFEKASSVASMSTTNGTTAHATWQQGESAGTDRSGGDVWYTWRPAVSGSYDLLDLGGSDPALRLLVGSTLEQLDPVPAVQSAGALQVSVVAGRTYHLQASSTAQKAGSFQLAIRPAGQPSGSTGARPLNDNLSDAQDVTPVLAALSAGKTGELVDGSTVGGTVQPGEQNAGAAAPSRSVWYTANLPAAVVGHRLTLTASSTSGGGPMNVTVDAGSDTSAVSDLQPVASGVGAASLVVSGQQRHLVIRISGPASPFRLSGQVRGFRLIDTTPPVVTCSSPPANWTRDPAISCTARDVGGSGLTSSGLKSFTLSVPVAQGDADGSASTPSKEICDKAGNCTTVAPVTGLKVDLSTPQVLCDPSPTTWSGPGQARVHCRATDTGSGLAHPSDGSFWLSTTVPSGSTAATASFSGHAAVCDKAGNCTDVPTPAQAEVDRQAPAVRCSQATATWTDTQGHVTCTAKDTGSGLLNAGDAQFTLATSVAPGASSTSARTVSRRVCDRSGNCATAGPVGGFRVDRTAPHLRCTPAPGHWLAATRWVAQCDVTDSDSGLTSGTPSHFTLAARIPSGSERQAQTGSRKTCDAAGNCVTAGPFTVRLDDRAPAVTCGTVATQWRAQALAVRCSAIDNGAGLGTGEQSAVTLRSAGSPGQTDSHVVLPSHRFCDALGHCTTTPKFKPGRIDRQAPLARCAPVPAGPHAGEVSVKCVVTDQGSGLADPSQAQLTLATSVPAGQVDVRAATNSVTVCDAVGNCAQVGPVHADVDMSTTSSDSAPRFAVHHYVVSAVVDREGQGGVTVSYPLPHATGDGVRVVCNPASGSTFVAGVENGTCTAVDGTGRTATIPMTITTQVQRAPAGPTATVGKSWLVGAGGFAHDAAVTVAIDGQALGTAQATGSGDAVIGFKIPRSVHPGVHQVAVSGSGPGGQTQVAVQRLQVSTSGQSQLPTLGGQGTALGRLALRGKVATLRPMPSAAPANGPTFGGGVPEATATAPVARSASSSSSNSAALVVAVVLGVLGLLCIGAAIWWRRRRHGIS